MTTLLSWISYSDTGEESHLPRAVYLVSDSRITWGTADRRWENGRKVFAPLTEPHLFGYSGDVVLPALILGQVVSAMDARVLFDAGATAADRHQAVFRVIRRAVACAVETPTQNFTIHHLLRESDWPNTTFRAWHIAFDARTRTCSSTALSIPTTTNPVASFGRGSGAAKSQLNRWNASDAAGRSRAVLSSFCEAIRSGQDPLSGGPPQLAALYTSGSPVQIGMCIGEGRYLNGLAVGAGENLASIEWRDELGQVVNPTTGLTLRGARRFARPRGLAS
ncbi:MAG: hypothetical protein ACRETY_07975 [Steroidobacteraceae bacterium]